MPRFLAAAAVMILFAAPIRTAAAAQAAQPASGDPALADARRLFDTLDYERAVTALDAIMTRLATRKPLDAATRATLAVAYELRGRARFGLGDADAARADFRDLLAIAPDYALPVTASPRVVDLFNEIRTQTIARVAVAISPADAELELDQAPLPPSPGSIAVPAGEHTLVAKKAGYKRASQNFVATPGQPQNLALTLERISAAVSIVTVPAAVDVIVDGVPRGTTGAGALPAEYSSWPDKLGVPASNFSRALVLEDLAPGSHLIEFRKDCHVKVERRVDIAAPSDYPLDPVRLERAVATVRVDSSREGSIVYVDGQPRGSVPVTLDDVCEGPHTIELRTPYGRYVRRVDARPHDAIAIQGTVRPAFALLAVTGGREGLRGGPDLRLTIERVFGAAQAATFFAPPAEQVATALQGAQLTPGWLAFDRERRPIGDTASNFTASARAELSGRLSRVLDVQGVAEVTAQPGGALLLSMLASGSGEPDVIEVQPDQVDSVQRAIARLEAGPPLTRPSIGLSAIDVADLAGAAVVAVEPGGAAAKPGAAVGDVIVKMNGRSIESAVQLNSALAEVKPGDRVSLEVRDKTGASKTLTVPVTAAPRVATLNDRSLLLNRVILSLRAALSVPSTVDEALVRLNLAAALMRVGNWADAQAELERVTLPDGPGISHGTVQYFIGLCQEAVGRTSDAERSWRAAAAAEGALVSEDGPTVKEAAERKLAELKRRAGSS
jgi:hypothetical protein